MPPFQFQQFQLSDQQTPMKVGTDAVLLGALTKLDHVPKKVLDVGTGCGILALMLAQRLHEPFHICALEIMEPALEEARQNFLNSRWKGQIEAVHGDVRDWEEEQGFDLIVSNPPFFEESTVSSNESRASVRSTLTLTHTELLDAVVGLLSGKGFFQLIIPYTQLKSYVFEAGKRDLFLWEQIRITNRPDVENKRVILRFSKQVPQKVLRHTLSIRSGSGSGYSEEFKMLTKDFYLYF